MVLEIAYIGNHAVHLPVSFTQLNVIPRQFLSTLPYFDTSATSIPATLTTKVTNPFKGLLPGNASLNGSTVSVAQLLAAYPEFPVEGDSTSVSSGVVEQNATIGSSTFNSLNVRVEKRLSHGVSLIGTYAWSKLIEKDSWLNTTDPSLEKRISPFDHTHHFVTAVNYELPIGRGKLLNLDSRWLDTVVGGWQVNAIYSYQTGAPLLWENGSSNNPGDYVVCSVQIPSTGGCPTYSTTMPNFAFNNRQTVGSSFDTSYFVTASGSQFKYHIRTLPTTFSQYRQDGINNFDASVIKNFNVSESKYFQFRAEAFNVLNHPTFAVPNLAATNASFGVINAMANRPRQLQLGARFVF